MSGMTYGQSKKRNVFSSFHYADVMRVNNVRKSGEFKQTSSDDGRSIEGFYDYSLWENRRLNGEDALMRLIREYPLEMGTQPQRMTSPRNVRS
ncbi:hypothetical protein QMZ05_05100 [Bradyrhizobium sp. INPA03-11B]|uniref:TIR domain-containing protein n=1 Tax=Bradyrhizobium sp. INPA03-11B TaxID=418598 RepID=UPI00338FD46B